MAQKDIIVFSEDDAFAAELLGGAAQLAEQVGGAVACFAIGDQTVAENRIAAGADVVYLVDEVPGLPVEGYASALADLAAKDAPAAILVGATSRGKGFASMVAAKLDAGMSSEARNIRVEDGQLVCECMIYGGLAVSTQACLTDTFVMTVSKLTFEAATADPSRTGQIVAVPAPSGYGAVVTSIEEKSGDGVDLSAAKSIVSFGRGVAQEEDIDMLRELASLTDSELGCTRPIAADYHWMPTDRYVGLSGKAVKPQLYFSVGSSGQIQQMAGAQDARVIVAICKDDKAPIFNVCDYGIVGDLYEYVPAINAKLKSMR